MKLATAAEMRELDRRAIEERGIPSINLMERAARAVADAALELLTERPGRSRIAVFCGSGNNGGDGIAAARLLAKAGVRTRAFLAGDPEKLTPDAREELRRLEEQGGALEPFDPEDRDQAQWSRDSHVVIDAIFGVGLSRAIDPESKYGKAIDLINRSCGEVVAVDVPSGVSADTGEILGCAVHAFCTETFTRKKIGLELGKGEFCAGLVEVVDIGIPKDLEQQVLPGSVWTLDRDYASWALPLRQVDGHKGTFGKVLIVGGSVGYTGAPYLAASAAVHSGCGLTYLGVPEAIWQVEAVKCVSAMPFPLPDQGGRLARAAVAPVLEKLAGCQVLALGPGLGRGPEVTAAVLDLLEQTAQPVVLDADGINALEGHIDVLDARWDRVTILTPHDGEFARIGGDLSDGDRVESARRFARQHGCILVLKGHRTLIATPAGTVLVNTTGLSGLSKGGSGDVLTGLIASLLAQGCTAVQAAALGVWLHGQAGELAELALSGYCMTPEDVIDNFSAAMEEL